MYPGRDIGERRVLVHVFDAHGKAVYSDAAKGLSGAYGLKIDRDDNLYVLNAERRAIDGKPVFKSEQWVNTGVLIKFKPGKGRLVSASINVPLPLPKEAQPNRNQDIEGKWVEGAEWMYGGVGLPRVKDGLCFCTSTRFDLDLFGRSFAPEWIRGKVAVVDSNGNLILRVGRIGNVDDGKPLVAAGGPPNSRSIGGDEVSLFHPFDVATHSDRRVFVHDWGNARIVSVKLDYHATETVPLKEK